MENPTNNPENYSENKGIATPESQQAGNSVEDAAAKMAVERTFRDNVIDEGEKQWYTQEKETEIIEKEKSDIEKGLSLYADTIEQGIRQRKEPVARTEELPQFLRACGIKHELVRALEKAFPIGYEGVDPYAKYRVIALYESVNSLIGKADFSAGLLTVRLLETYEQKRRANFVSDQTTYVKYLDRLGEGFYSTDEGQELVRRKATEQLGQSFGQEAA